MWHMPSVSSAHPILKDRRVRNAAVAATIVVAHLGVFAVMGRTAPGGLVLPPLPPVEVLLVRPSPPPPPPPPPDTAPSRVSGGGAPAAPSRIHTPPPPPVPLPDSPPAPIEQAPEPAIIVGAAPISSGQPGFGQGGEGNGTGTGVGDGSGPGSGSGPMIIRGANPREIFAGMPPAIRRANTPAEARVNCEIGLDQRLAGCRVVEESPEGQGVGPAAIAIAERHFRFNPPRDGAGRPVAGQRVTVMVSVRARR